MKQLLLKHATLMSFLMGEALSGQVERVEVAGSIRRGLKTVNGIDFVIIPKSKAPFMFKGKMVRMVDGQGSPERIIKFAGTLCRPIPAESYQTIWFNLAPEEMAGYTPMLTDSSRQTVYTLETVYDQKDQTPEGVRITIAIANERNWGSVLLHRTGSKAFNEYLIARAQNAGFGFVPEVGLFTKGEGSFDYNQQVTASETEDEIFKALKLKFVEPEKRERK